MRNAKAESFNREASDPKSKPDFILGSLSIEKGQKIADIGSGGGYFAMKFAGAVGKNGVVFALDTNPGFLAFIEDHIKEKGIGNIRTLQVNEKEGSAALPLPKKAIDLIFMRNVYHHMKSLYRIEYMKGLSQFLKPSGRIAIIDYSRRGSSIVSLFGHYTSPETMRKEMEQAGYRIERSFDLPNPKSSFTVFSIKKA